VIAGADLDVVDATFFVYRYHDHRRVLDEECVADGDLCLVRRGPSRRRLGTIGETTLICRRAKQYCRHISSSTTGSQNSMFSS
jgi:hypothetical protein